MPQSLTTIAPPTMADAVAALDAMLAVTFDDTTLLTPLIEEYCEMLLRIWNEADDFQAKLDVDAADQYDWIVDMLGAIVGLRRRPATRSEANVALTGEPSVLVPAGSFVESVTDIEIPDPGVTGSKEALDLIRRAPAANRYETLEDVRLLKTNKYDDLIGEFLPVGTRFYFDWEAQVTGAPLQFVVYEVTSAGLAEGSPPSWTVPDTVLGSPEFWSTGNSITAKPLGLGIAVADVRCRALAVPEVGEDQVEDEAGAYYVISPSYSIGNGIIRPATSITGWSSAIGLEATDPGKYTESNEEFAKRIMRGASQGTANQCGRSQTFGETEPVPGLEETLKRLPGVVAARVVDQQPNGAEVTAYVLGGDTEVIALELFNHIPFGVNTLAGAGGTVINETIKRDDGREQAIVFNRPGAVPAQVQLAISIDIDNYAGDEAVIEAVQTLALNKPQRPITDRFTIGQAPVKGIIQCAVLEVAGVTNVYVDLETVTVNIYEYATLEDTTVSLI